jgi:hypothetical protein
MYILFGSGVQVSESELGANTGVGTVNRHAVCAGAKVASPL